MGRRTTGALTTDEVIRIELSYLLKNKFIQKGNMLSFTLSWTNGSSISVVSCYKPDDIWLQLIYTVTEYDGQKFKYDYKIYLTEKPSNLSVGSVLYFVCPRSGNLCRILYKCYGSHIWKSRGSYQNRIYYSCQTSSKLDYFNDRYWKIDKMLKKLRPKRGNYYYKNVKTKRQQRIDRLEQQQIYFDNLRWTIGMPKRLRRHFGSSFF